MVSKRGYPEQIIDCGMKKVKFCDSRKKSERNNENGLPFAVTYRRKLKDLSRIIKYYLYFLYVNDKLFTPSPIISFRSSWKISTHIVRVELYAVKRTTIGSYERCKKYRKVCGAISETDTFSRTVTDEGFKIKFNCNHKCRECLATCKI